MGSGAVGAGRATWETARRFGRPALLGLAALVGLTAAAPAADPARAIVAGVMRRHPDPTLLGPWNYPTALYLYGQYRVFQRTGDRRLLGYVRAWVDTHVDAEGVIDRPVDALDRVMPGLLLLALHDATGDARYARAAKGIRRALDAYPRTPDGGFWHAKTVGYRLWGLLHSLKTGVGLRGFWRTNEPEGKLWADGAFMAVPFLLAYEKRFPDGGASRDEAVRQLLVYAAHLQDPATGLLYHAFDATGRAPWLAAGTRHSREFWCRAVGWYGMALVEALDGVGDHPGRPALLRVLGGLAAGLRRAQDPRSGLWFQVIDKGGLPGNWVETSCSAMFAHALTRAVERRHLPADYAPVAARARAAVLRAVAPDGEGGASLGNISAGTSVGALSYYLARPRLTDDFHGLGAFLLMHEGVAGREAPPG